MHISSGTAALAIRFVMLFFILAFEALDGFIIIVIIIIIWAMI